MNAAGPRGRTVAGPLHADVVVIGGGIAGAAAALAARRHGRSVALVRRSWGNTALASGTLDLAPDPLAAPGLPLGERRSVLDCVRAGARLWPGHPWTVLAERPGDFAAALVAAREESGGRLAFGALAEENHCLLTPLATLKLTAGGVDDVLEGDLRRGGVAGVVGFRCHPAWDAALLARALREVAGLAGVRCGARAVACDFLDRVEDFALRPHQLAARIAADPERLAASIRRALPAGVERLLLPPLLGTDDPRPVLAHLEEALGLPCAELPAAGTAPVPGLRLQRLLEARLEAAGVELWLGEAHAEDGAPDALQVHAPTPPILDPSVFDEGRARARPEPPPSFPVRAGAVVLATGRFVGGGIRRDERLREAVFDLPVTDGGGGRWAAGTLGDFAGEQELFRSGVRIDAQLRPLDRDGRPRGASLFACGSVVGGSDPARDGAGHGLSWCTGWLAGEAAARQGG